MIAPAHVLRALNEGDIPAVQAYLDEGGNVNAVVAGEHEIFCAGDSLLMVVAQAPHGLDFTRRHVALAKLLVQHGADVNHHPDVSKDGYTALHCCIDILIHNSHHEDRAIMLEILGVLVTAGANANLRNAQRQTPLGMALQSNYWNPGMGTQRSAFESVKLLLRAGASLDACRESAEDDDCTAEEMLRKTRNLLRHTGYAIERPNYADGEHLSRASSSSPTFAPPVAGNSTSSTCRRRCYASGPSSREAAPGASSASARGRRVKSNSSSRRRSRTSFAGECSSTGTRARNVTVETRYTMTYFRTGSQTQRLQTHFSPSWIGMPACKARSSAFPSGSML